MEKSSGITDKSIGRGQTLNTATPMDNLSASKAVKTSIRDTKFGGSDTNLKHSLSGASAVSGLGTD